MSQQTKRIGTRTERFLQKTMNISFIISFVGLLILIVGMFLNQNIAFNVSLSGFVIFIIGLLLVGISHTFSWLLLMFSNN